MKDLQDIIDALAYAERRSRRLEEIESAFATYQYRCDDVRWDKEKAAPIRDAFVWNLGQILRG
jgi:hypothetical protein